MTGIDLTEPGARHLSEWICAKLPQSVQGGEIVTSGDIRAVVRKARRGKVLEAQIERQSR